MHVYGDRNIEGQGREYDVADSTHQVFRSLRRGHGLDEGRACVLLSSNPGTAGSMRRVLGPVRAAIMTEKTCCTGDAFKRTWTASSASAFPGRLSLKLENDFEATRPTAHLLISYALTWRSWWTLSF